MASAHKKGLGFVTVRISDDVRFIIDRLEQCGFEAYIVGGCVRDAVLGKVADDWDICTSALPEQTALCFDGYYIIETGIKHGTITLRLNDKSYEITTYRIDGEYSDSRRPDSVEFTRSLKSDLSRRDFTLNAMAYNPKSGIVDYFGGLSDIKSKVIRCVGDPEARFQEDALRIMRALRFASVLVSSTVEQFQIEQNTASALLRNKELLNNISTERIAVELDKLLMGPGAIEILNSYTPIFEMIIPDIQPSVKHIKRWLNKVDEEMLRRLVAIKRAHSMKAADLRHDEQHDGQGEARKQLAQLDDVLQVLDDVVKQQCFSVKDLAVNGNDLIAIGFTEGSEIGAILNQLLELVINEQVENEKEALLMLIPYRNH